MALSLLALLFAALAFWMARRIFAAIRVGRDWPTVPGRILERGVGAPMQAYGLHYYPHVKYTYTVDGIEHTNAQVYAIGTTGGRKETIRKLVDALPDPVPVHYDPVNPGSSYLILNSTSTAWLLLAVGAWAVVLSLIYLFTS